jgi:hypothetical protein
MGAKFKRQSDASVDGGGRLRATWYRDPGCDGSANIEGNWVDPKTDVEGWQTLEAHDLQRTPGAASVLVRVIQHTEGEQSFVALWDEIYFRTVDE